MLLLLERFQIVALIIAYFVAILARGLASYFIANKFCFPQRILSSGNRSPRRSRPRPRIICS